MAFARYAMADQRQFQNVLMDTIVRSRLLQSDQYIQHGNTTVLRHSVAVAWFSLYLAGKLRVPVHKEELVRGALLHDYFLYDWHEKDESHRLHGFRHPYTALRNAMEIYDLTPIEQDIIKRHMFPLTPIPPRYRESVLVCIADKICSAYETLYLCSQLKAYSQGKRRLEVCLRELRKRRKEQGGLNYGADGAIEDKTNLPPL